MRLFQSRAEAPDVQQKFAEAARLFLKHIRAHVQLTLLRHISALSGLLNRKPRLPWGSPPAQSVSGVGIALIPDVRTGSDMFFARRTIHQAATAGAPPALSKEAEVLLEHFLRSAPHPEPINASATPAAPVDSLDEPCPACGASVPLLPSEETEPAVCANGHVWGTYPIHPLASAYIDIDPFFEPPPNPFRYATLTAHKTRFFLTQRAAALPHTFSARQCSGRASGAAAKHSSLRLPLPLVP